MPLTTSNSTYGYHSLSMLTPVFVVSAYIIIYCIPLELFTPYVNAKYNQVITAYIALTGWIKHDNCTNHNRLFISFCNDRIQILLT